MEKAVRAVMAVPENGAVGRSGPLIDGGGTMAPDQFDLGRQQVRLDHFVERDGMRFAGTHLIADFWQASNLDDITAVNRALRKAASAADATLLNIDLHCFTPNGGITGVAVLAESHISIHTWPECSYAAVDIFMCGGASPHKAVEVLRRAFAPGSLTISEHKRGVMP